MLQQTPDVDEYLKKAASKTVVQGENLRAKVRDLTLEALQAGELSLVQIKHVLKSVAAGVNSGAAKARIDVEKPLADALNGMDDALLNVVRASRVALERMLDHGADFQDSKIRNALDELERLEDAFLGIVRESAAAASEQIKAQWGGVLEHLPAGGTCAGVEAEAVVATMADQAHATARRQRNEATKVGHMLAQNYATLARGILIGLAEGLRKDASPPAATRARPRKTTRA